MIASRLGVWISAAVALALAIAVVIDLGRATSPPSRALVPGFATAQVTRLVWTRGTAEPAIELVRADALWRWAKPVAGIPAEPGTVDGVLAALRGARWHRRGPIARAGAPRVTLTVGGAARTFQIGVGDPLAGAGQTWLAIDGEAYLVDDWVARALAPDPLALRETHPFRDAAAATTIVIERIAPQRTVVRLAGHPRRLVQPRPLLLATERAAALERALAAIAVVATPSPEEAAPPTIAATLSIDGPPLVSAEVFAAPCRYGARIAGTPGPACVTGLEPVWEQLAVLHQPARDLVEPRLVPVDPVRITFADGGVLDLAKRPTIDGAEADVARVAELVALLQTPLTPVDAPAPAAPLGTLTVTDRTGDPIVVELLPDRRVRRAGEPVAFAVGTGAWEILARPAAALRDPVLWREDPLTIQAITVGGTTYRRTQVIGEWTDRAKSARLEALARALALPRGEPVVRPRETHGVVSFTVVPPIGAPIDRTLRIGARCYAEVDDHRVVLDEPLCAALGALPGR